MAVNQRIPTLINGSVNIPSPAGNVSIEVAGNAAASTSGNLVPNFIDYIGYSAGGTLTGVSTANGLPVVASGVVGVTQGTSPWVALSTSYGFGSTGAILDAAVSATTSPINGVATLVVCNTAIPSVANGQSIAAQCDYAGNQFVRPFRRSQMVSAAGTLATTTATQIIAAQGAGIYCDLSNFVATAAASSSSVVSTAFTVKLSDNTNTYVFGCLTGSSLYDGQNLNIAFNPPLPAATANTSWTVQISTASATVYVVAAGVLQKGS